MRDQYPNSKTCVTYIVNLDHNSMSSDVTYIMNLDHNSMISDHIVPSDMSLVS
ncbi:hypothetical protein F383_11568 [Gossypium arboreum]|uniref:Uncharacterized protein n=1 Tax=Gossypium arboreum TaxID=29729 RepID=A0A0B0Q0W9_GOSAR|nr:hypothetical protein F383_11568 [Gossypium arboreum]